MKQSRQQNQVKEEKEPKQHRSLGKTLTYIFTVVILLVIAVTFIGTPAVGGAARGGQAAFGEYAGEPINYEPGNYFARTYQTIAEYVQESGQEITDQVYYSVWQTAYYEAVFHKALVVAAQEAGMGVSPGEVDRAIATWPEFQVGGRFSTQAYQSMSSPQRLILREFLRESRMASQVRADIAAGAELSDAEIEFVVNMASPERRFRFVQFSFTSFPDERVAAYGQENRDRFRQIGISQITIASSQSDAERIRQQAIDRTASFEDLARNQSADAFAEDGGARGRVYYWDLEFDFEDVALVDELFSLREGDVSPVYKTGNRWRIYRVDEAPIDPDLEDRDVLEEVRGYMTSFERGLIEDYLRENGADFAATARDQSFEAAALEINQAPQLTEFFPVNYGNLSFFPPVSASANSVLETSAAFREEFLQQLFALGPGEVTEPIVVRDFVMVFELAGTRELDEQRREELRRTVAGGLSQAIQQEANQYIFDDDRFVDNFNEVYSRAVLGQ